MGQHILKQNKDLRGLSFLKPFFVFFEFVKVGQVEYSFYMCINTLGYFEN